MSDEWANGAAVVLAAEELSREAAQFAFEGDKQERRPTLEQVEMAWRRLTPQQRQVLYLRYGGTGERLFRSEIGRQIGRTESTVRQTEKQARERLKWEVWAASTGFSGLSLSILRSLRNCGVTSPEDLPQGINDIIRQARYFGSGSI